MSETGTALCTGARVLDDGEVVECGIRAEWLVGTTPACGECIATFLDDNLPAVVSPIDSPAILAPVYTITPPAVRRIAEGIAKGIADMIAAKVPRGTNGGELVVNQESIASKIEAAIVGESKRVEVEVEAFLAGARAKATEEVSDAEPGLRRGARSVDSLQGHSETSVDGSVQGRRG